MPALYSKKPIGFRNDIDGSTAAHLYAGITTVLTTAGWVGSAVTGGMDYTIESPQELVYDHTHLRAKVRVWIESVAWADGTADAINIQFRGYQPTSGAGMVHWLRPVSGSTWVCWANACTLAIARLGISRDYPDVGGLGGNSFFGGIPFVQGNFVQCGLMTDPSELWDVWFSSGDTGEDHVGLYRQCLRNSVRCDAHAFSCSSNGVTYTPTAAAAVTYGEYGVPSLLVFEPGHPSFELLPRMRWWNESATVAHPVYYQPMVGWGMATEVYPRVRGTLFDSMVASVGQNIDAVLTLHDDDEHKDHDWYNYTFDKDTPRDGQLPDKPNNQNGGLNNNYGSLLLMTGTLVTAGNIAY